MGRHKKLTEAELENTQTTLTIEDSNQAESEEAELLAETDSEVVAEVEAAEEVVAEEPVKKPRKPRKPRAKKVESVAVTEEKAEVSGPAPVTVAAPAPSDTHLDQWAAIKQLSESVALILENSKKLQAPPPSLDFDTNEFLRPEQQAPKTLFITKFATAASIVATILSLVSLSLSQSARQAVLGALEPLKQSQLGIAAKPSTGEEALPFRRSPRRNR
ncbi:MAG: hypothetical protein EBQ92_05475 [Proteobacteria bacterium]|nr:hypothetical protein [Pseudomonadota bacterium]